MTVEIGDMATWAATILALVAMVISWRASKEAKKEQEEAAGHQREIQKLMSKQNEFDQLAWVDQYFLNVRDWANEVCHTISETIHLIEDRNLKKIEKTKLLTKLSALLDTGRWYFPNLWDKKIGTHKEPAYRGVRQPVLDHVFDVYVLLDKDTGSKKELIAAQRRFVSEIQKVLDPRMREQRIGKVLEEFYESERLRDAKSV